MSELDHITDFINSPAFAIMSEDVKSETICKQTELAKQLVKSKINEVLSPILERYNLDLSFEIKVKEQHPVVKHSQQKTIKEPKTKSKKAPQTGLCVILPNGDLIQENKAADTFAEAIRLAGPDRVKTLGLTLDKENIILLTDNKPFPIRPHEVSDGYYVNTHSNTASKQRMLEKISNAFKLSWKVKIVE